jgi:cell fate regulator YaaT (PSP1 superfamily)
MFVPLVLRPSSKVGTVSNKLTVANYTHVYYKNILTEFYSKGKRLGTNTGAVFRL